MSAHYTKRSPFSPQPETSARVVAISTAVAVFLTCSPAFPAEQRVLIQGLADGEVVDTDADSLLLARNQGDPAAQRRLRLWTGARLAPGLSGMILGRFEGGDSDEYIVPESKMAELEQAWIRYVLPTPVQLIAQAGRMPQPIGGFSRRYLSTQNPLIGKPASYEIDYPYAVELTGRVRRVDFLAAMVDKPLGRQIWLPEASSAPRPAVAAGVTPFTGFRLGAHSTWGPYLAKEVETYIPAGRGWRDYAQRVVGLEIQFSRGHYELNAEMTRSHFEMPGQPDERGIVSYVEQKYTWSPLWYTALRVEKNNQASVWLPRRVNWYITDEDSWDLEAGAGFRIDPRTVVKVSYRVERSTEYPSYTPEIGHALALQLSVNFDVRSWLDRPR